MQKRSQNYYNHSDQNSEQEYNLNDLYLQNGEVSEQRSDADLTDGLSGQESAEIEREPAFLEGAYQEQVHEADVEIRAGLLPEEQPAQEETVSNFRSYADFSGEEQEIPNVQLESSLAEAVATDREINDSAVEPSTQKQDISSDGLTDFKGNGESADFSQEDDEIETEIRREEAQEEERALRKNYSQEAIHIFLQMTKKKGNRSRILPAQFAHLDRHTFSWKRDRLVLLAAFFVPFIILGIIYAAQGFYPFGNRSPLTIDLYHQYAPFLSLLRQKVLNGESLWYSWQGGLGFNFLANFAYYSASPLNLLFAIFPLKNISEFVIFLELLKVGLSGLMMALFLRIGVAKTQAEKAHDALVEQDSEELADLLPPGGFLPDSYHLAQSGETFLTEPEKKALKQHRRRLKAKDVEHLNQGFDIQHISIFLCSVLYALSGYVLAYSWNIMWLDVLVVFPLVLLGIHRLVNQGKFTLYSLALGSAILLNYYMAIFVCIFGVIYFVYYLFTTPKGLDLDGQRTGKLYLIRSLQMFFSSLLAGGMASVLLLPTYQALQTTSAVHDSMPSAYQLNFSLFEFFSRHLFGLDPAIREGLPNIYAGVIILLALPLYLSCKKIKVAEKIGAIVVWFILFVSFNSNLLNFFWHGLHYPNQLPHRFAFVYIIFTLVILFRVLQHLSDLRAQTVAFSGGLASLYLLLAEVVLKEQTSHYLIYLNLIFVGLYTAVLYVGAKRISPLRTVSFWLALLIISEIGLNGMMQIHYISENEYYAQRSTYIADIDQIQKMYRDIKLDDPDFYRFGLTTRKSSDDPALYGFEGLSIFSSTTYREMASVMRKLGFHGNGVNSYVEDQATAISDMLFGIKYIFRSDALEDKTLETVILPSTQDLNSKILAYRRKYSLPVGYVVPEELVKWEPFGNNALANQNEWMQRLTKSDRQALQFVPIRALETTNFKANEGKARVDALVLSSDKSSGEAKARLVVTAEQSGQMYLFVQTMENINLGIIFPEKNNTAVESLLPGETTLPATVPDAPPPLADRTKGVNLPQIVDLGHVDAGEHVEFTVDLPADRGGEYQFWAASLDEIVLQRTYEKLQKNSLHVEKYNSNTIVGTADVSDEGHLFFSIPYDKNWTVTIDGEVVETKKAMQAFLSVPIKPGKHQIQLVYRPMHMNYAFTVSLVSVLFIFLATGLASAIRKRREEEI